MIPFAFENYYIECKRLQFTERIDVKEMKKHQKTLICLMALGLLGTIGTSLALSKKDAEEKSVTGGTDGAIYLRWSSDTQIDNVATKIENIKSNEAQYTCVIVAPKASTNVKGTVSVKFELSIPDKNTLDGFTVAVYNVDSYTSSLPTGATKAWENPLSATNVEASVSFSVDGSKEEEKAPTKYYLVEFLWDGTPSSDSSKTFGGTLKISQSFTKAA